MHSVLALSLLLNVILLMAFQFSSSFTGNTCPSAKPNDSSCKISPRLDLPNGDGQNIESNSTADAQAQQQQNAPSTLPLFQTPIGLAPNGGTTYLSFVEQLWPLRRGRAFANDSMHTVVRPVLQIPPNVRRICIDVGTYLHSPTSRMWWSLDPSTFIVAFEPNVFSVALMKRLANPIMLSQISGYFPFCPNVGGSSAEFQQRDEDGTAVGGDTESSTNGTKRESTGHSSSVKRFEDDSYGNGTERASGSSSAESATTEKPEIVAASVNVTASVIATPPPMGSYITAPMVRDCMVRKWGHITSHTDRFLLIPVALSATDYFSSFQVGLKNRADMGSLLNFKKSLKKKKGIAHEHEDRILASVAKLSHILQLLPSHEETSGNPIMWDTLKIDAQGIDSLIIAGAGPLLAHFVCIIGEFDTRSYEVAHHFNYRQYLKDLLFIRVEMVFINMRFAQQFLQREALCRAPDVRTKHSKLAGAVNRHLRRVSLHRSQGNTTL